MNHWQGFREFCFFEKLYGGPDPHLTCVVESARPLTFEEQIWRVALYVGFYNVPSAEAVWRVWTGEKFLSNYDAVEYFIHHHWREGFRLRRERKTCKSPPKMMNYLSGYQKTLDSLPKLKSADPEEVWDFAKSLPRVGRYAATKLCECWYRLGLVDEEIPDIRPAEAWSPRTTLAMLFPDFEHDPEINYEKEVQEAHELSAELFQKINETVRMSIFEMEVMLCEYKASYKTHRQYPGRSLDSELTYENAIKDYWKAGETEHMKLRRKLFPAWSLGEIQGWNEVRKPLGYVLSKWGYTWSDWIYDYNKSLKANEEIQVPYFKDGKSFSHEGVRIKLKENGLWLHE